MAVDLNTNAIFPNVSVDSTAGTITFTLTDFTQELVASEVDPTSPTVDWRELIFSFLDHLSNYYSNLPDAERPTKITVTKSGRLETNGKEMLYTYNVNVSTKVAHEDVSPEP